GNTHPDGRVRLIARRSGRLTKQMLAARPLASLEATRGHIMEVAQRVRERERAGRDTMIGNDEIPRLRYIAKTGRVGVFASGKLVEMDGVGAGDPIASVRQLDGRSAVEQQVDLEVFVGVRQVL